MRTCFSCKGLADKQDCFERSVKNLNVCFIYVCFFSQKVGNLNEYLKCMRTESRVNDDKTGSKCE